MCFLLSPDYRLRSREQHTQYVEHCPGFFRKGRCGSGGGEHAQRGSFRASFGPTDEGSHSRERVMEGIRYIRQFSFTDRRTHFAEQLHYRTSVLVLDKR